MFWLELSTSLGLSIIFSSRNIYTIYVIIGDFELKSSTLQLVTVYRLARGVFLELCFRGTKVFPAKLLNAVSKVPFKFKRIVKNGNPNFCLWGLSFNN